MRRSNSYSIDWNGKKVLYHYEGSYYAGNWETPPEYPELIVESIDGDDTCDVPDELLTYIDNNHEDEPLKDEDDYYGED